MSDKLKSDLMALRDRLADDLRRVEGAVSRLNGKPPAPPKRRRGRPRKRGGRS